MDFSELKTFLDRCDRNLIPSSHTVVMRDHEILFDYISAGDATLKEECESRPLCFLFSASKVITCTAIMRLIEEGKLSPDDPVSKYLPEYAHLSVRKDGAIVPSQTVMLIRHLLTMGSGISYDLGNPVFEELRKQTNNTASTRQVAEAIARMPMLFEPGERFCYGLAHDILAAIAEVVTGKRYYDYLKEVVFDPLNMTDFTFDATSDVLRRMNRQYRVPLELVAAKEVTPACVYKLTGGHQSGGAGLIGSARQYARLLDSLACADDGKGVLKKETVDEFRRPRLNAVQFDSFQAALNRVGYSYGYGVRTLVDPEAAHTTAPVGEFGWDGAAGAYALVDPEHHLSIFYMQHVLNCGYAYSYVHPSIRNLVYEIIGRS